MIKRLSLLSLFTLMPASFYYAQTTVYAYVKDVEGKPVERAEVDLRETGDDVVADKIGYFQFVDLMPGHYKVTVSKSAFEPQVLEFDVKADEKRKDLGVITLMPMSLSAIDQGLLIVDSNAEDEEAAQSTVGLLQSSRDVFSNIAGYDLGFYWFRPRGLDSRMGEVMMNGVSMINADNGRVDFANWGGLNEITRYPEIAVNHAPSEYAFGGTGSVVYKNTRASEYRKGSQLTYSLTNRNYRNRLSYRFSSGMNRNGWAFTGMLARRWAEEGIQEGTFYDALSGYLGVEKRINDNHTVTLNAIGSNYRRSTSSPNTQEVYDYRGVHYNSYWGWQDGKKRSERVRKGFQPIIELTDYWKINDKSNLWTTVSYQFGQDKGSRLDWYKANNPSPTYYRNLPSFYLNREKEGVHDSFNAQLWRDRWENNDQDYTQINWNNLYEINRNVGRSVYYLVNDVADDKIWNVSTHYTNDLSDKTRLILNLSYQNFHSDQYREVKDLLGGAYALNQDAFSKQGAGMLNSDDADVRKKEGDKIGYDYTFSNQQVKFNPGLKFSASNFDVFVSGLLSYTTGYREGHFQHYLYKNSFGKSDTQTFWDAGIKGQVTYKFNGRNFLVYNGAYFSQAPYLNDIFINARVTNAVAPNIKSAVVDANDLSYVLSTPFVKVRATAFLINTRNATNVQRFFADGVRLTTLDETGNEGQIEQGAFVTQALTNVDKRNMGVELGAQVKITPTLTANGLLNYGQYTYQNNPHVYFMSDAVGVFRERDVAGNLVTRSYKDMGEAALKNYMQGGTPQEAYSLGLRYSSPNYWWVGANWNYLGRSYLDPSPVLRTDTFIQDARVGTPYEDITEDELRRLLKPTKLPEAYFFNANIGKSWILGKYYVLLTATVNNILDNKKYITGGFEQTRNITYLDYKQDVDSGHPSFAPKYWYTQGRSYFINAQIRF